MAKSTGIDITLCKYRFASTYTNKKIEQKRFSYKNMFSQKNLIS